MFTYYASYEPQFISEYDETKLKSKFQTVLLKEMNVFINKIDEQSVSKRQRRYGATERTNELTRSQVTSNINLLIQLNE